MPMEDHRLKAFCLIVEMRSFSKAAETMFMTQSAMSHLIKNLEDDLGMRLLSRKGRSVMPTSAGNIFYGHAKRIIEAYKIMENDIYCLVSKIKGPFTVGASPTAATYLLPQVFYDFSRIYPEVRLDLSVSNTEHIINELYQGKIDVGIVEGPVKDMKVSSEEIADDEIVLIASDDNPLTRKKSVASHDLITQPFIMPEAGSGTREIIDDFLRSLRIDVQELNIIMTLGDPGLLVQMVQSGMGISFVSKWSVFKTVKEGTIKILSASGKKLYRKFYLISLDKEPSVIVTKTFMKFIKGYRFFTPF
jgi:LysR family transcriptional regulator, transcriptional activator of the cysJI operon